MTLPCPACGEVSEFQLLRRLDFNSETGDQEYSYAICGACHAIIDATDLDRQAEQENQDQARRAPRVRPLARIRPVTVQDDDRTRVEFRCDIPLMAGMEWIPATVITLENGWQRIAVASWMLDEEQCVAMTIAMRMALEWCARQAQKEVTR